MGYLPTASKIRPNHLERCAYIYVRQSTLIQVRENTASALRQYDLAGFAAELGWEQEKIVVVDQDQGRSGASTEGRDGFKGMLSEIILGNVGAVISLEASRLARDSSDWHYLLRVCDIKSTLIIDERGVYDPSDPDDRFMLGLKGTMSHAELSLIASRVIGGRRKKAAEGDLCWHLPTGFVHDAKDKIVLDPDEEVRHAVRLLFDMFDRNSSVLMAVREFNESSLLFPSGGLEAAGGGVADWVPLRYDRALAILHHPIYAGAYVYGRTRSYWYIDPNAIAEVKKRVRNLEMEEWDTLKLNNHEGYITWEQYLHNQTRIANNRNIRDDSSPGAIRSGAALLQGILRCGKCGRQICVGYPKGKKHPTYYCYAGSMELARATSCQRFSAKWVDKAVAAALIGAIRPAQLQLSIDTFERLEADTRRVGRQWDLRVERASYEADLARRRFTAVDPENRLVASNLEREWEEKLAELERLKRQKDIAGRTVPRMLSPSERQSILDLARDLPRVWDAATTTQVERKQLLRYLIKDVVVLREGRTLQVNIRWQTETFTRLDVNLAPANPRRTDLDTLAMIRELSPTHTDQQIADRLNEAGIKTRRGLLFNRIKIGNIRYYYDMPLRIAGSAKAPGENGRCSPRAASRTLNVCLYTILRWCNEERLDAVKSVPGGRWQILLTPEKIAELKRLDC